MTVAEELVARWLGAKGYFVMRSVKYGRKEVDILAIKLASDKKTVDEKAHVEVQVSSRPFGQRYTESEYGEQAEGYVKYKFGGLSPRVRELLGEGYTRWLVIGKLAGGKNEEDAKFARWRELGVSVFRFDDVVKEYLCSLTTRPTDEVGQLLHTLVAFDMIKTCVER